MASIFTMIKKVEGLIDTKDVNAWENTFLKNIVNIVEYNQNNTVCLSTAQMVVIERIYNKHFAG